jgi:hypothetical protein
MDRRKFIQTSSLATLAVVCNSGGFLSCTGNIGDTLSEAFLAPPPNALPGCYWWWLNGKINREGIARDLREFKEKGINDLLLVNSTGRNMPAGVRFLSDEWKELFRFALTEAKRHGIEVGVNLCSGWCMGGPWITPEMAGRWFLQSELRITGPVDYADKLPLPGNRSGYDNVFNPPGYKDYIDLPLEQLDYRDTAVVAFRLPDETHSMLDDERKKMLPAKTNRKDASNHAPARQIMAPASELLPSLSGDQPVAVSQVVDLTGKMDASGVLHWHVPDGNWVIVRTGHRMTGSRLSIAQPEADGLSVGWLNSMGVDKQFEMLGTVLLEEAGKVGCQLKFFCDDSFEDGFPNWTSDILEKFKYYRGYDPVPYLPVFSGYIVGSAEVGDRFLHDYRKTVADCMADAHYGRFAELCHRNGLKVQNESAGPSRSGTMCMDALKNLGRSDFPAGEFWLGVKHDEEGGLELPYGQSRLETGQNKVTKMVASAAHIYGKNTVTAESYTTYRHWTDSPASLKQATDRAFCEGVNRILIHTSTATCPEDGKPGYEYYAGTHFNPNVTWWDFAGDFLHYIGRCQHLLRQGKFVADVLFYNGDGAPNIVEPKHADPSLGKGYDYDVCNEEVLLKRLSVKNERLVLPDGMQYRILVLPDSNTMPMETLEKITSLVSDGATVIGKPPTRDSGLKNYPDCDRQIKELATALWGDCDGVAQTVHRYGKGRVFFGKSIRAVLSGDGIVPDFETAHPAIDFIHRATDDADIYFVSNLDGKTQKTTCTFRMSGRQPELWDAVSGKTFILSDLSVKNNRTSIPMEFAGFQSYFVVFPKRSQHTSLPQRNAFPALEPVGSIDGQWTVRFDPAWGAPEQVVFDSTDDWTQREEAGIRYYSGKATYSKIFHMDTVPDQPVYLDLGMVREIARVRLNGTDLGILWTNPWRTAITNVLQRGDNRLEIDVINNWNNRLAGDAALPESERLTHTNVVITPDTPLRSSGLLGPVTLLCETNRHDTQAANFTFLVPSA